MLKKSHVLAWFDGADDYTKYDVDVLVQDMDIVDELDVRKWKEFVERMHQQGKVVFAELRPLTHVGKMFEYVMSDPGLQETVCVDFNLNPIKVSWMRDRSYKGRPVYLYCSNHPRYRAFLRHQVFMFVEAGVDGIMVDDGGGSPFAFGSGGCCCPYCMAGFREYLRNTYTAEQLQARGVEVGDAFDYRQIMLRHCDDQATLQAARQRGEIPLSGDFQEFLLQADVALFRSLQEMACKLSGKHVPMGWDNVNISGRRAPYYGFLDVFYSEIGYQRFALDGQGVDEKLPPGLILPHKVADALGKFYTPTPAPASWGAVKQKNLTGVLQLWVAFSYANGGPLRYPRKGWCFGDTSRWYYPPKDEFEPLYDFVREHRKLLDGYEAVEQVGVLFTQNAGDGGSAYYTPLRHVCGSLVELNIPFGMTVAGDRWLPNRLRADEVERFELMLVPEPWQLDAEQKSIVESWKKEQKAIAITAADDVGERLKGRIDPLVSLEGGKAIWLFPRKVAGTKAAPVVCHLLNWSYDARTNRRTPQTDVGVRLRGALVGDRAVRKVTYYTVGKEPQALRVDVQQDGIRVNVPEVDLWGILQVEP